MSLWQDFLTNDDLPVHKWLNYFPAYERHFARFRNLNVTFLEIGVGQGGSLRMWRRFFGPYARIIGIDVNPACERASDGQIAVRIGSQADEKFLGGLIEEFGVPDIVLDDGSHRVEHVDATFNYLFPRLGKNAIYAVEDLHTMYWQEFGGALGNPQSFIERVKGLIDQLHADHSRGQVQPEAAMRGLSSIHCYDRLIVLEKLNPPTNRHQKFGRVPKPQA